MIVVDDKEMEWSRGLTVSKVLQSLDDTELCSVVRINGKLVSSPKFDITIIEDNSVIQLLPLIAGG